MGWRVIFFLFLSVATMTLDLRRNLDWLHATLSTFILPVEYTLAWPPKLVHQFNNLLTSHKSLLDENERLKSKQLFLQSQIQRLMVLEEENGQLRALLRSAPQTHSSKVLVAQQLASNADPFLHEVTLDVGKNAGVFAGQAMVDSQGVMGQIIQVNPVSSRALLIIDTRSAIPVQNKRTGQRAIVVGNGIAETLHLNHVPETADIKMGDILVCSGLGGYFPEGYPVGYVKEITKKRGEEFANILVIPYARFDHHQVLLLWPTHENPAKK